MLRSIVSISALFGFHRQQVRSTLELFVNKFGIFNRPPWGRIASCQGRLETCPTSLQVEMAKLFRNSSFETAVVSVGRVIEPKALSWEEKSSGSWIGEIDRGKNV